MNDFNSGALPVPCLRLDDGTGYVRLSDYEKLKDENERLRELMHIMHSEMVSCEDNGYICGGHKFDKRVRELRVEVDG